MYISTFEEILDLPDDAIKEIMTIVDPVFMAKALTTSSEALKEKILKNMCDDMDYADYNDYDFVVNAANELMLVIYAPDNEVDKEVVTFLFDGKAEATLIRNRNSLLIFNLSDEVTELLHGGLSTLLVNEIDEEGNTVNIYDAKIKTE